MKRSFLYFVIGTALSFLFRRLTEGSTDTWVQLYTAAAFGIGWGLAYFVDHPEWPLIRKMGFSLVGMAVLVIIGLIFFSLETALSSIIRFSTVFVAYYMIASFRESKSLRY